MPKLDQQAISDYWDQKGENMALTLSHLEESEPWPVADDEDVNSAVRELGETLEELPEGELAQLAATQELVDSARVSLAYMKASTRLRLLSWMAEERTDGAALAANILSPNGGDDNAIQAGRVVRDSLRHLARLDLMYKVFSKVGYSKKDVNIKFEGMIKALSYGAPPHGGMAPGIDRIVMLLANEKNIREVTMFPMNQNAQDLMMNAPSKISDDQLKELNLAFKKKN